jgi:hypothetical protein
LEGVPVLCAEQDSNTGRKAREIMGLREIQSRHRNRPARNHVRRRINPVVEWVPQSPGDILVCRLCRGRRMEG